jgi:hypothetical protein
MAKPRQSHEAAKAFVSPLFAWTNAVLKGGEMMLDSMAAAAKNAKAVRVAVLPDADAPRSRPAQKAAAGRRKAKRRR